MEYRNLGRTGVKVSPLCLGVMNFTDKSESRNSWRIMDRAVEDGINFIDTANVYGRGASEEILGDWLDSRGHRDRLVVATKFRGTMDPTDPNSGGHSYRHVIQACEDSLRRLKTDYIDLYQIHKPGSQVPIDETLRALDKLVRDGKVLYLGTTTFPGWRLMEALAVSKELGLNRFVCEQPAYNFLDRRVEREVVPFARTYGLGLIPWGPLAYGFLTGKYRRGQPPPAGARIQADNRRATDFFSEATFDAVERVAEIAREKGYEPSEVAIAWLMNQPGVTAPIIGPKNEAHYESYLRSLEIELNARDIERLDEVNPPGRACVHFFETDLGPSVNNRW